MPEIEIRVIDVYPYRLGANGESLFLLLRRSASVVYAGSWRMVGGKIASGEPAWQAALREVEEETGQTPSRLWALPSINTFYEWQHDRVNLVPAFAAELYADPILDREHDAFAWLPVEDAAARLCWPEQQRLLRLAHRLLQAGVPPEWIVSDNREG